MDTSLNHSGTKGMRWGIRRYQNSDGSLTPAGREHYGYGKSGFKIKKSLSPKKTLKNAIESHKEKKAEKQRNAIEEAMERDRQSNEQLKQAVERMALEKRYQDLYRELHPEKQSAAKKFVSDVLTTAGKQVATEWTKKALNAGVGKMVDSYKSSNSKTKAETPKAETPKAETPKVNTSKKKKVVSFGSNPKVASASKKASTTTSKPKFSVRSAVKSFNEKPIDLGSTKTTKSSNSDSIRKWAGWDNPDKDD